MALGTSSSTLAWGVGRVPRCREIMWNHVKSCEILRFHIFWLRIQDQSLKSSRRLEAIADACGEKKKEDAATPSPCYQKLPCTTANLLQVSTNHRKSIDHTAHTKYYEMAGRSKWHLTCSLAHIFFACTYSSFCWIVSSSWLFLPFWCENATCFRLCDFMRISQRMNFCAWSRESGP